MTDIASTPFFDSLYSSKALHKSDKTWSDQSLASPSLPLLFRYIKGREGTVNLADAKAKSLLLGSSK